MALSVRLEPAIEARIEQEARRLGITKSEFVKDALERALGLKNPADLLRQVRSDTPVGATDTSEDVSEKVRKKLTVDIRDFSRYRLPDGRPFSCL